MFSTPGFMPTPLDREASVEISDEVLAERLGSADLTRNGFVPPGGLR